MSAGCNRETGEEKGGDKETWHVVNGPAIP